MSDIRVCVLQDGVAKHISIVPVNLKHLLFIDLYWTVPFLTRKNAKNRNKMSFLPKIIFYRASVHKKLEKTQKTSKNMKKSKKTRNGMSLLQSLGRIFLPRSEISELF